MNIIRNEEDMKQADSTYYYNLTVRYLNGELDSGGEKELFRFVKESPDNERLFRQWKNGFPRPGCCRWSIKNGNACSGGEECSRPTTKPENAGRFGEER